MAFGKRRAAVAGVVMVCGAMALVPFVSAQTLDRDLRYDVFRAFGAGSEIGVSVRELSNDEVSKAGSSHAIWNSSYPHHVQPVRASASPRRR